MDERELTSSVEIGVAKYAPVHATLKFELRRRWEERSAGLLKSAGDLAGLSPAEMEARLRQDEDLADLVFAATERSRYTASSAYRTDLATLVSAAFRDAALVEPVAYLTNLVIQLEPADLRALKTLGTTDSAQPMKGLEPHTYPRGVQVSTEQVADGVSLDITLAAAALSRLESSGFAYTRPAKDRKFAQTRAQDDKRLWSITPLGARAIALCEGQLPD